MTYRHNRLMASYAALALAAALTAQAQTATVHVKLAESPSPPKPKDIPNKTARRQEKRNRRGY